MNRRLLGARAADPVRRTRDGSLGSARTSRLPTLEERMRESRRSSSRGVEAGSPAGHGRRRADDMPVRREPSRPNARHRAHEHQPRIAWAPDYPWGMRPEDLEEELRQHRAGLGNHRPSRGHRPPGCSKPRGSSEFIEWWRDRMRGRRARRAAALLRMFYESDVRDILRPSMYRRSCSAEGAAWRMSPRPWQPDPRRRHVVMPGAGRLVMASHSERYVDEVESSCGGADTRRRCSIGFWRRYDHGHRRIHPAGGGGG